jgi:hypothetical protein
MLDASASQEGEPILKARERRSDSADEELNGA